MSVNILLFFRFVSKFCHSLHKNRADPGLLRLNAAFVHQLIQFLFISRIGAPSHPAPGGNLTRDRYQSLPDAILFTDCFQLHGICRSVKRNNKLVDSFSQFNSLNYKSITCSSSIDTRYLSVTSLPVSWESALAYHSIWLRYRAVSSSAVLTRSVL